LERLGIKQTKLARYLGLKPSNFSKILSGSRKLNLELSLILGQIFELDPQLWMSIQLKNDYEALKHAKGAAYQNYCLGDLVEYRKNQD
ncbi:MAG: addiction module antidote protein, HigA family, partial [Bacteroidota bacterium]